MANSWPAIRKPPPRPLEPGESDVWVSHDAFVSVLDAAAELEPTWLLSLDADERFDADDPHRHLALRAKVAFDALRR